MLKEIEEEIRKLKKVHEELNKELENPQKEVLCCRHKNKGFQYYIAEKYQGKNKMKMVKKLAEEDYSKHLRNAVFETIKKLEKVRKIYSEEVLGNAYMKLHEGKRALITNRFPTFEELKKELLDAEYDPLPFSADNDTEYFTNKGERVRSKSEKIIADELLYQQIPYRNEMPLVLRERGKQVQIRPDFTVISPSERKIKYIEHLGMLDSSGYYIKTLNKLDLYEKNGLLIGRDVILTHETSYAPFSTETLKKYIDTMI